MTDAQARCTPRRRYTEREEARQAAEARVPAWKDPFTPLERWFSRLPCNELRAECHCGSGRPVLYWSPEDGTGCEDCRGSLFIYIPEAVVFNIAEKFGITGELRARIYAEVEQGRGKDDGKD